MLLLKRRVLITGGRAPVALGIARNINRYGANVFVAESLKLNLCRFSNCVERFFNVPSPRFNERDFINSIIKIINEYKIDFLIPTCEETFYISGNKKIICEKCPSVKVFVDDLRKIAIFHNKFEFITQVKKMGYDVPKTFLIRQQSKILDIVGNNSHIGKWVLKPVYSRFGSEVKIFSKNCIPNCLEISEAKMWLLQEFIDGEQLCSYAICHAGMPNAIVNYRQYFNTGNGAGINFINFEDSFCKDFIANFVATFNIEGQISFDFIKSNNGKIFLLECNPRSTSGVHFLGMYTNLMKIFLNEETSDALTCKRGLKIFLPMLLQGLKHVKSFRELFEWMKVNLFFKDVIFSFRDIKPFLFQILVMLELIKVAFENKLKITQASTYDIEWNGER